jgi:hypothetical protein
MKKKNIYRLVCLAFIFFVASVSFAKGQAPPPPGGHGRNGNQGAGGAAPIDGGSLILLMSGLSYGAIKAIRAFRRKDDVI